MTIETAATLLERDRELGQFGRAFSEAEEGRGHFVSVDSGVVAAYIVALDSGTVWLCFSSVGGLRLGSIRLLRDVLSLFDARTREYQKTLRDATVRFLARHTASKAR